LLLPRDWAITALLTPDVKDARTHDK